MQDAFFIFCAEYLFILPIIILGAYFFIQPRKSWKGMAAFAISSGLLAYVIGLIGGWLYFDPRPFVVEHFIPLVLHIPDNGFPSDHVLLTAVIAMIGMKWNRKLGIALWILALLIAVARVYVGVHYPIDVIGSIAIAIFAAWAVTRIRSAGIV